MRSTSVALGSAALIALVQYGTHAFLFLSKGPAGTVLGYGLMVILSGLTEAVLLALLSAGASRPSRQLLPVIWVFVGANVGHAAIALAYFFPAPAVFDGAVTLCLLWAAVTLYRQRAAPLEPAPVASH